MYRQKTGTTGESLSLTKDERKTLSQAWVDTGINVIVHVGSDAIGDSIELATHAESIGAKAIGAMPPFFFKPANAQALALTISTICAAVPNLPCYYYHIPSMTGYAQPMYDFVEAIAPLSDNFCGIKYTGLYTAPGFMDAQRVMNFDNGKKFGPYEVLGGREELMLEALSLGIKGFVGSQFNVAADLYNTLHSKFESEGLTKASMDELRSLQYAGIELISAWQGSVGVGMNGNKALMNLAGVPVGPGRLPSLPVDDKTISTLKSSLESFCKSHADLKLRACVSSH